jgi:hypothetical protein
MRFFHVLAAVALLAVPADLHAQTAPVPGYGEPDKDKTPSEVEAERTAERAYKRSLGSVPNAGPSDPWGSVRSEAPKTTPKQPPAKRIKPAGPN